MNVVLNVVVEDLEKYINRQIIVDENISLIDLFEYIIISMNGKKIPIYVLEYKRVTYLPFEIEESNNEKTLVNLTLKDLKLKKKDRLNIKYNFNNLYTFNVTIDDILEKFSFNKEENFEVLSGKGYGILDTEDDFYLKGILKASEKQDDSYFKKSIKDYLQKTFNVDENNAIIKEYSRYKKEQLMPKSYVFNVSLEGFDKEIKRKICVNNYISIDRFCRIIIKAMNGDLSHSYGIKINKEFLGEYYNDLELYYLGLKEKQRLKVIYDYGDNWTFNITLSKIIDGYRELDCEVLSGKGYGIIDDCGGIWGLGNIFYADDYDCDDVCDDDCGWGKYDINEFNLEECNEEIRKT